MVIWPKKNSKMGAAAGSRRKSSPPWEVERGLRAGPPDGARPLPTAPELSRRLPRPPGGSRRRPTAPEVSRRLPRAPDGSRRAWGRREPSGARPARLPGRPPFLGAPPARHGFVPLLSSAAFRVVLFVSRREATGEHTDPACRAAGRGGGSALGTGRRRPPPAPASLRERRAGPLRVWGPVSHSAARTGAAPRPAMLRSPHGDSLGPRRRRPHRRGAAVSVARAAPSAGRRSAFRPTCGRRPSPESYFLCERIFAPETLGAASITDRGHPRSRRPSPPPAAAPEDPTQVAVPAPWGAAAACRASCRSHTRTRRSPLSPVCG